MTRTGSSIAMGRTGLRLDQTSGLIVLGRGSLGGNFLPLRLMQKECRRARRNAPSYNDGMNCQSPGGKAARRPAAQTCGRLVVGFGVEQAALPVGPGASADQRTMKRGSGQRPRAYPPNLARSSAERTLVLSYVKTGVAGRWRSSTGC